MTARRHRPALPRLAGFVVLLLLLVWFAGFVGFAATLPAPGGPGRHTDAIVVLTGGSGRLATGFDLLHANRGDKLFVSGVSPNIDRAELASLAEAGTQQLECCVALGYAAADTVGNAAETAAWMREQGYASLRLVTADYHMRRSLLEFQRAMPAIAIVPHPVAPTTVNSRAWWRDIDAAWLVATEYSKFLIARLRGLLPTPAAS